jgi:hypothetical protein
MLRSSSGERVCAVSSSAVASPSQRGQVQPPQLVLRPSHRAAASRLASGSCRCSAPTWHGVGTSVRYKHGEMQEHTASSLR